jgi:transmembrane sensor
MSRAAQAEFEAAEWLIEQADGPLSPDRKAAFDAWLSLSESNKAAYWRLEFGWEEADRVGALGHDPYELSPEVGDPSRRRWWVPAAIAASVALAVGLQQLAPGGPIDPPAGKTPPIVMAATSYSTALGRKRLVGLPDGSRIQLNTQSKVRTELSPARREAWLDHGEAFFEIARHDNQPFIVHAGDRQITVLGTKFAVRRDGDKVVVAVLEGRVQLDELKGDRPTRSAIIVGGDIAMAAGPATLVTARSEEKVENALSWRQGNLMFEQERLAAIADEFNRYNEKKLVVDARSAGAIRITGTFPANRPDAFARLLRDAFGLQIDDSGREIRVSG